MQIEQDAGRISRVRRMYADGSAQQLREAARLSTGDLGRAAGVSRVAISAYEAGRRSPRRDVALRLAAVFDALEAVAS